MGDARDDPACSLRSARASGRYGGPTPREFSLISAIARRLGAQLRQMSAETGRRTPGRAARRSSLSPPEAAQRPFQPPDGLDAAGVAATRRAFLTASASLGRREIASLSAMMPMVRCFVSSRSTATNPTPRGEQREKEVVEEAVTVHSRGWADAGIACLHRAASASPDPEAEASRRSPEAGNLPGHVGRVGAAARRSPRLNRAISHGPT